MLTSATSKNEAIDINRQLDNMARASGQSPDDIRLCYVTVRIAKPHFVGR